MSKRDRSIRTEGIVLRRRDFGESDRILVLFTRKLGRISTIAKGSRKPSSRMAGHLELFMRSSFLVSRGRNLHLITQAETLDPFNRLRENLEGIGRGAYLVELVENLVYEEGSQVKLYDLLVSTLEALNAGQDPALVTHYFELHLLGLVGFQPELFICVECGQKIIEQDQYLSGSLGGVVCPRCAGRNPGVERRRISSRVLKYLRHIQRSSLQEISVLKVSPEVRQGLAGVLSYYLSHTLEGHLNSLEFISRLKKHPPKEYPGR